MDTGYLADVGDLVSTSEVVTVNLTWWTTSGISCLYDKEVGWMSSSLEIRVLA